MTKRIAIFAHYDKDHIIDDYVIYYLTELKKVAEIVFVSDCNLPDEELAKIEHLTIRSIAEPHGEYDFGSYKVGFKYIQPKLQEYDELLFVNDSCYGPFWSLQDYWDIMTTRECDFWGLFEHFCPGEKKWYVQSYFIVFKKQIFTSQIFADFILGIRKLPNKAQIVAVYEIGLSELLHSNNFSSASICPKSIANQPHTNDLLGLVSEYRFPLLKRSLLATNPCNTRMVSQLYETLKTQLASLYDFKLIENHLQRTAPDHKNVWHFPISNSDHFLKLLGIPIIGWKFRNKRRFCFFSFKFFGLTIFKLPVRLSGKS